MTQGTSNIDGRAPFDSLTLSAVVPELRERLIGGQVQDIRQPSPSELRIVIRSQGRTFVLALSCDARFARVHLTSQKPPNAAVPPSFCMALRKHCEGAIVRDVRQRGFDRIVEIEIGARSAEGDIVINTLIAELMGKHSNLILVSAGGVILEAAKRVSRKVNRVREILPGLEYRPPPEQLDRLDPFDARTPDELTRLLVAQPTLTSVDCGDWLVQHIGGMSPFMARHIAHQIVGRGSETTETVSVAWEQTFGAAKRGEFHPVSINVDGRPVAAYPFPVSHLPSDIQVPITEFNGGLDAAFSEAVVRAVQVAAATELRGQIARDRKRLLRQKDLAERTLGEGDRAERYKQTGELILANLWKIEPGAASITVQDYFDLELGDATISLDPKLSPQVNAEAMFRRYRKTRDGQATAETRRAEAQSLLQHLDKASIALDEIEKRDTDSGAAMFGLRDALGARGLLAVPAGAAQESAASGPDLQGHKIRRFTTPEGYEIYWGETATANDYLTLRLASSNDLWLHVRASTSSHVVIKTRGKPESVPRSVIESAALLCARHSSQKHSGLVPVDYTLKKHVRKPRGAAPGSADYHHETTLHVSP